MILAFSKLYKEAPGGIYYWLETRLGFDLSFDLELLKLYFLDISIYFSYMNFPSFSNSDFDEFYRNIFLFEFLIYSNI